MDSNSISEQYLNSFESPKLTDYSVNERQHTGSHDNQLTPPRTESVKASLDLPRINHSSSDPAIYHPYATSDMLSTIMETSFSKSHLQIPGGSRRPSAESRRMETPMSPVSLSSSSRVSHARSESSSYQTDATSLPALQATGAGEDGPALEPVKEEEIDPASFDLVTPVDGNTKQYSLETRSEQLFSRQHLEVIFADPTLLLRFTTFLSSKRPSSIPMLIYYLDAVKALKAINYSNAIAEALEPIPGYEFTSDSARPTVNSVLEVKAKQAFDMLVQNDLPAYITDIYVHIVGASITKSICGTLPVHLRAASEGLAEVFCLTDPSRPDNPIVFASEEFHRTTQYGMSYVIGRNCRFLQGPKTNPFSVKRLREKVNNGQEHHEVFLNYRRDGSPFMNLLMVAPLCDSRGKVRYCIGAQVDVSGLVKECSGLESLKRLVVHAEHKTDNSDEQHENVTDEDKVLPEKDEFQELSEMFNMQELDTVRCWGGRMHRDHRNDESEEGSGAGNGTSNWAKPRLLIHDPVSDPASKSFSPITAAITASARGGRLGGVYENYLLVRPYPSLRILFASPSLRVPGILQSPFLARIGGSPRIKEELTKALADGRGVTAKIRWVNRQDPEGRSRWIHATPLLGHNGAIGVWMVVLVDDENEPYAPAGRVGRIAPPVDPRLGKGRNRSFMTDSELADYALSIMNGSKSGGEDGEVGSRRESLNGDREGSVRTGDLDAEGRPPTSFSIRSEITVGSLV